MYLLLFGCVVVVATTLGEAMYFVGVGIGDTVGMLPRLVVPHVSNVRLHCCRHAAVVVVVLIVVGVVVVFVVDVVIVVVVVVFAVSVAVLIVDIVIEVVC